MNNRYCFTVRLDPINKARFDWLVDQYGGDRQSLILRLIQDGVERAIDRDAPPDEVARLRNAISDIRNTACLSD